MIDGQTMVSVQMAVNDFYRSYKRWQSDKESTEFEAIAVVKKIIEATMIFNHIVDTRNEKAGPV